MACLEGALRPLGLEEVLLEQAAKGCALAGSAGLVKLLREASTKWERGQKPLKQLEVSRLPRPRPPPRAAAQWWPELQLGAAGEPRFAQPAGAAAAAAAGEPAAGRPEGDAQAMLQRALGLAAVCEGGRGRAAIAQRGLRAELLLEKAGCTVWMLQLAGSAVPVTCSEAVIETAEPLEALLWAVYHVEERLKWDGTSFLNYKVLSRAAAAPGRALRDTIYCRMPAPHGVSDRDVVQERFLVPLQEGGFAIVMRSLSEGAAAALCEPLGGAGAAVRATTLLSAYLLRPLSGGRRGVRITVMSQTDMGGSIPAWAQSLAKKAGTRKFVEWSQRLRGHCEACAREASSPGWAAAAAESAAVPPVRWREAALRLGGVRPGARELLFALAMLLLLVNLATVQVARQPSS